MAFCRSGARSTPVTLVAVACITTLLSWQLVSAQKSSPLQQQPQQPQLPSLYASSAVAAAVDAAAAASGTAAQQTPSQRPQQVVKCPPCAQMHCMPKKASKLRCRGGVTTGICGCCPECAKVENEPCGGEWNYLGKCDAGLYCEPRQATVHSALLLLQQQQQQQQQQVQQSQSASGLPEGRCRKIPNQMMDSDGGGGYVIRQPAHEDSSRLPTAAPCEPRCTPDFCEKNPKAICSAIDVVDLRKDCQGKCQHTSCQACYWVEPEVDCGSCPRDDYDCIRKFARCVRRRQCSKDKQPCRPRKLDEGFPVGKFQCEVPRCHGR